MFPTFATISENFVYVSPYQKGKIVGNPRWEKGQLTQSAESGCCVPKYQYWILDGRVVNDGRVRPKLRPDGAGLNRDR